MERELRYLLTRKIEKSQYLIEDPFISKNLYFQKIMLPEMYTLKEAGKNDYEEKNVAQSYESAFIRALNQRRKN